MHLGQNISKIRGFKRLPQKDIASKLNLTQPEYSRIEKKEQIDDDLLERIATILEVSPEAIKNFSEDAAINIISSTLTLNDNASSFNTYPVYNFNPIDKLVEMHEENKKLYEQLLREKDTVIELYKQQQKDF